MKDFQFFAFILLSLTAFRLILMALFASQISEKSSLGDLLLTLWMGLRLDMGTAASWIIPTFLFSLSCLFLNTTKLVNGLRGLLANVYVTIGICLLGADIAFFYTYGDHYNSIIVGLLIDDAGAIFSTLRKEYSPILSLLGLISCMSILRFFLKCWMAKEVNIPSIFFNAAGRGAKIASSLAIFLLLLIAVRGGSVNGAPLQIKDIFVTNDNFLNKMISNPLFAFRNSVKHQLILNSNNGLAIFWPPEQLDKALAAISSNQATDHIDQAILKTAPGHQGKKPRHITIVLMESYSGWTLLPQYQSAGFSPGLLSLSEDGLLFSNFLASGKLTIDSLGVILSGLPFSGLNINYEAKSLDGYATSPAKIFQQLGYKTRFFYGGYLGWQRLDSFVQSQGFEEVYSAASIDSSLTSEWGVKDELLFSTAQSAIEDGTPSFNVILTTSCHSPYEMDLKALGFPVKKFPDNVISSQSNALTIMGHHWYADREVTKFVKAMATKLERPLFALTGDHPARMNLSFPKGSLLDSDSVPLLLYGPLVLQDRKIDTSIAGAHLDLIPTLINLSAEKNFQYPAFGNDLFQGSATSTGFSDELMLGSNFVSQLSNYRKTQKTASKRPALNARQRKQAVEKINATRAIGWYMAKHGTRLKNMKK
ncbi:MAG: sulfatase-like hydrolase/transferase [Halioglobus sp.]